MRAFLSDMETLRGVARAPILLSMTEFLAEIKRHAPDEPETVGLSEPDVGSMARIFDAVVWRQFAEMHSDLWAFSRRRRRG